MTVIQVLYVTLYALLMLEVMTYLVELVKQTLGYKRQGQTPLTGGNTFVFLVTVIVEASVIFLCIMLFDRLVTAQTILTVGLAFVVTLFISRLLSRLAHEGTVRLLFFREKKAVEEEIMGEYGDFMKDKEGKSID